MTREILCGDSAAVMGSLPEASVDAVVTDPPYGINIKGKAWDSGVPGAEAWAECLRVLKPGGHLLAFAAPREYHNLAAAIVAAGFDIRDVWVWCRHNGGGMTQSDIGLAIDKRLGVESEVIGKRCAAMMYNVDDNLRSTTTECHAIPRLRPSSPEGRRWWGWGSAFAPRYDFIAVARKPLRGALIDNVMTHGVGAINIDDNRIPWGDEYPGDEHCSSPAGRRPTGIMHDGSQGVLDLFPRRGGKSAARFFYCPRVSRRERDEACENHHPTVKPIELMRRLCRLVTPPEGLVLDPFCGSGTTLIAAMLEGFDFIGIDCSEEYVELSRRRVEYYSEGSDAE